VEAKSAEELEINLTPDDKLLLDGIKISLKTSPTLPAGKIGLYGISRSGQPGFIAAETESSYIGGTVKSLGRYRLMADTTPPRISQIKPRNGGRVTSSRPTISFRMSDDLSGFASDSSLIVTLNGEYQISEYDVDNQIVYVHLLNRLSVGKQELLIQAEDRMGNKATSKSTFYYQPAQKK